MKNYTFKQLMFILILWVFALPAMGSEHGCGCEDVNEVSAAKLQSIYKGDNGSLVFVRRKGSGIYWFVAKVFFSSKSSSGVKIEWIDTPLGNTRCHGKAFLKS